MIWAAVRPHAAPFSEARVSRLACDANACEFLPAYPVTDGWNEAASSYEVADAGIWDRAAGTEA